MINGSFSSLLHAAVPLASLYVMPCLHIRPAIDLQLMSRRLNSPFVSAEIEVSIPEAPRINVNPDPYLTLEQIVDTHEAVDLFTFP